MAFEKLQNDYDNLENDKKKLEDENVEFKKKLSIFKFPDEVDKLRTPKADEDMNKYEIKNLEFAFSTLKTSEPTNITK